MTGKKVLFIDSDLRKDTFTKCWVRKMSKGLSDNFIWPEREVESIIERVSEGDFDYICRGQTPPNPAELLMHPRFKGTIICRHPGTMGLVIVDTPPILAVTDAAIIREICWNNSTWLARFEAKYR